MTVSPGGTTRLPCCCDPTTSQVTDTSNGLGLLICQLRVANNVDEFRAGGTALQWAMSSDQGRQIAQQLIEAADQIDQARPKDS